MIHFEEFEEYKIGSLECENSESIYKKKKYKFQTLKNTWITKDGEIIKLSDMELSHLINSKRMIERSCKIEGWNPMNYPIYVLILKEIERRFN